MGAVSFILIVYALFAGGDDDAAIRFAGLCAARVRRPRLRSRRLPVPFPAFLSLPAFHFSFIDCTLRWRVLLRCGYRASFSCCICVSPRSHIRAAGALPRSALILPRRWRWYPALTTFLYLSVSCLFTVTSFFLAVPVDAARIGAERLTATVRVAFASITATTISRLLPGRRAQDLPHALATAHLFDLRSDRLLLMVFCLCTFYYFATGEGINGIISPERISSPNYACWARASGRRGMGRYRWNGVVLAYRTGDGSGADGVVYLVL